MSFKLSENVILSGNSMRILSEGTKISEATIDLDQPEAKPDSSQELIGVVQQWVEKNRPLFGDQWVKIVDMLQPAIDAIQIGDLSSLKAFSGKLATKAEKLAVSNPKAANALERIHALYRQLLAMSRSSLGEGIDEIINMISESHKKIKALIK